MIVEKAKVNLRQSSDLTPSNVEALKIKKFLILKCIFAFCIFTFAFGCARTVTPVVNYGEQMRVSASLAGTMDVENNRYFMVFSDDSNYKVPLPPPDIIESAPEFIEPGMTPETGSAEAYYSNFFDTWSGYIVVDPSGYSVVCGPFVEGQTLTREVFATLGEISDTISFTFLLGKIFDPIPAKIYFDFICVSWPDGEEKIPYDHLPSTDNYISYLSGSIQVVTAFKDVDVDVSLDILELRVEME
ncbi:MAG: hypothetical protein HQ596_06780 [Candidatus Saganbacteria bacterium]|nr:hypothetical protein [Candidatus Saganbacteria bacterium]